AAADIFRAGVADAVRTGRRKAILDEEIKIPLEQLPEIGVDRAGDLLLASREISLQSLPNLAKSFLKYFNVKLAKNEIAHDIILAHECRHVIVHCGAVADAKMEAALESSRPRTLKPTIASGERVQFNEEIRRVTECMAF